MVDTEILFENNVKKMIAESKDVRYAQFLTQLLYRYRQKQMTKEQVMAEINRTYPQYLQRIGQAPVQQISAHRKQPIEKKNVEFAVGAWVLGVLGALLILIAFVMLGITYMNSFVKGLLLYVIAAVVLLASELAVAKKMPRFSAVLTGIGICGLFLATIINMTYLENFGPVVGGIVCAVVFIIALFLGKKKDSGVLHLINYIGCYLCAFPIWSAISYERNADSFINLYFIMIVAIVFSINFFSTVMYGKKNNGVVHILHQCVNTVLTIAFAINALSSGVELFGVFVYVSVALLMLGVNLKMYIRDCNNNVLKEKFSGASITYIVASVLLLVFGVILCLFSEYDMWLHISVGILILAEIVLFIMFGKNWLKWVAYESACFTVLAIYGFMAGRESYSYDIAIWVTIAIFVITKILAGFKLLYVSDIVITFIMAGWTLFSFGQADLLYALILFSTFTVGLFIEKNWKSLYEELLLVLMCGFVLINFMNELTPVILVCIIIAGFFTFNNIRFFRDNYIKVYNYINLGILGIIYMVAPFVVSHIAMFILLVLCCGFMIFAFSEKYGMNFRIKSILLILLLSYIVFTWNLQLRVINSILLMVISIIAVVAGFVRKEKKLRITGLVLSLVVCGKLLLYDFQGAADLEKIILFLTVGVIVLAISGVYIALEKKMM